MLLSHGMFYALIILLLTVITVLVGGNAIESTLVHRQLLGFTGKVHLVLI